MPIKKFTEEQCRFHPLSTRLDFIDLSGKVFGRLTVIGYAGTLKNYTSWYCKCDCDGLIVIRRGSRLRNGDTDSCGCLMHHRMRVAAKKRIRCVGFKNLPEFTVWRGMKTRCNNKNHKFYYRYGGRGIQIKFESFFDFLSHVGFRPTESHSIDRIDTNGHYKAGNVRWATKKEQANNTGRNRFLEHDGRCLTLSQWSDITGLETGTLLTRLKYNWCTHCVLTIPTRTYSCPHRSSDLIKIKGVTFQGKTKSIPMWARSIGISRNLLWRRLKTGWCIDCAITIARRRGRCHHRND